MITIPQIKGLISWALVACALMFFGCAGHPVRVVSHALPDGAPSIAPGSRIYFFEDTREQTVPQGRLRLQKKVENILSELGYVPSDIQHADYFMVLDYGRSSARKVRETIPIVIAFAPFNSMASPFPDVPPPTVQPDMPMTRAVPHTRTVYDIWINSRLMDANHYREHKTMKEVWSGKAWLSDTRTTAMGKAVGAMLPHLLGALGQTTENEAVITNKDLMLQSTF